MTFRSKRVAVAFAAACTLALGGAAAASPEPADCPTPMQTPNPVPVRIKAPAATLDLRVADTPAKREYGLMCVRALAPNAGMIFVFDDGDNQRAFWMKNTLIPLDMVFVLKNGRVNNVGANVPATTVGTPDYRLPERYGLGTYVIELAAGEAARAGIKAGTQLDLAGVAPAKE